MSKGKLKKVQKENATMVFQHFGLFDDRTVLANVEYSLEIRNMSKAERRKITMENIKIVGFSGYESKYPQQLSGLISDDLNNGN